jgi:hypothetical protein
MVKPSNGQNYNSFIFEQYFSSFVNGATAAQAATQKAIELINALPSTISLSDKAAIEAARAAYDSVATLEQKALITNYSKLTSAEAALRYFTENDEPTVEPSDPTPPTDNKPSKFATFMKNNWIGLTIAGCTLIAFAVYVVIDLKKKNAQNKTANNNEEE